MSYLKGLISEADKYYESATLSSIYNSISTAPEKPINEYTKKELTFDEFMKYVRLLSLWKQEDETNVKLALVHLYYSNSTVDDAVNYILKNFSK